MCNTMLVNKHILIVEDNDSSRRLLEIILKDMGCFVEVAVNGQEAVDKARDGMFDLVLMDLRLPVLNGFEATMAIRRMKKDIPIIALTAHAMEWVKEKCLECGMNDYLSKPFSEEKLIAMLLKWVK